MNKNFFVIKEQLINSIKIAENLRENSVTSANALLMSIDSIQKSVLVDNKIIDNIQTKITDNMNNINKNLNGLSRTLDFVIKMYDNAIDQSIYNIESK